MYVDRALLIVSLVVITHTAVITNCLNYFISSVMDQPDYYCIECREGFYPKGGNCLQCNRFAKNIQCAGYNFAFNYGSNLGQYQLGDQHSHITRNASHQSKANIINSTYITNVNKIHASSKKPVVKMEQRKTMTAGRQTIAKKCLQYRLEEPLQDSEINQEICTKCKQGYILNVLQNECIVVNKGLQFGLSTIQDGSSANTTSKSMSNKTGKQRDLLAKMNKAKPQLKTNISITSQLQISKQGIQQQLNRTEVTNINKKQGMEGDKNIGKSLVTVAKTTKAPAGKQVKNCKLYRVLTYQCVECIDNYTLKQKSCEQIDKRKKI